MEIITFIYTVISAILICFLVFPFFMVLFSFFIKEKKPPESKEVKTDFGCIITAYKNALICQPLIESLLVQNYSNYHVYLVADECDLSDFNLKHEKLTVFNPDPPLRLKAKSFIYAVERFKREHEQVVVFDPDNLAHPQFLDEINKYVAAGHKIVQGKRKAKNLDSMYACADATGEFYKNYTDRYLPYLLGSSSVISGSGMAVERNLFQAFLDSPEIEKRKAPLEKNVAGG